MKQENKDRSRLRKKTPSGTLSVVPTTDAPTRNDMPFPFTKSHVIPPSCQGTVISERKSGYQGAGLLVRSLSLLLTWASIQQIYEHLLGMVVSLRAESLGI